MSKVERIAVAALLALAPIAAADASPEAYYERLVGLTATGTIVSFTTESPNVIETTRAIFGIGSEETLLGLDFRPASRTLYTLSSAGNLYALVASAGGYQANLVGNVGVVVTGSYGIDFDPVADHLRVVTSADRNLRIAPTTAAAIADAPINYPGEPASDPDIVGIAYSDNRMGATATVAYGIDSRIDSLVRFVSPEAGTLQAIGSLHLAIADADRVSFEISASRNDAFLVRNERLFAVNLLTGRATRIGRIGDGTGLQIIGLAAMSVPEPASWALMIGGFGLVGGRLRQRRTLATA